MSPPIPKDEAISQAEALRSSFGFDQADDGFFARLREAVRDEPLGRLGSYELIAEAARGGQGVVYQVRQPGTNRIIALKRLWAGSFATATMRARFEREVEAASALNHPNVVRVFGAESIEGQPVLTMEWIDGQPIDRWAGSAPRDVDRLLGVFCRVCDAVAHAHRHGVLHRDLKPSNILVDRADEPHVLDFGLAKLAPSLHAHAPDQLLTLGTGFMGTPAYASPEQVSGDPADVDLRSDVYALGVVLYQMLTGSLPFDPSLPLAELFDAIRRGDPVRPSLLRSGLNREVEAIVMMAMARHPAQRYQSVDALVDDIRRHMAHQTVLAHPPGAMEQARKFIARHRALVSAALAVAVAIALSLGGVTLSLVRARAAEEHARRSQAQAEQINAFLIRMLASADPSETRGRDFSVSAMLLEAVRELDAGAMVEEPAAESQVRSTLGQTYESLGLYPAAQDQYARGLQLARLEFGDNSLAVADLAVRLGQVYGLQERWAEAAGLLDEAEQLRANLAPNDHAGMRALRQVRARMLLNSGDFDAARTLLVRLLEEATAESPTPDTDEIALLKDGLGYAGNPSDDPERLYNEALATYRALHGNDHEGAAHVLVNLAAAYNNSGRYEEAESLLNQALAIRTKLFGDGHPGVAAVLYNLGYTRQRQNRLVEAEQLYRRCLDIRQQRLVPGHYWTMRTLFRIGQVLSAQQRWADAEPYYRSTIQMWRDGLPARQTQGILYLHHLAQCLFEQHRFEEAEPLLAEQLKLVMSLIPDDLSWKSTTLAAQVRLCEAWGKPEVAAPLRHQLESLQEATAPHPAATEPNSPPFRQ